MKETRVQSLGREDPMEQEMATHSSILSWKIPWTERSGGLQLMGCKESDMTEHAAYTQLAHALHGTTYHMTGRVWGGGIKLIILTLIIWMGKQENTTVFINAKTLFKKSQPPILVCENKLVEK